MNRRLSYAAERRLEQRITQESPVKEGHTADLVLCPRCGYPMARRVARVSGAHFWGCSRWPVCRQTRPITSSV